MNLNKLMKQAQKMQEQMARTQAELEDRTIEVQAGGGKVKVTANGAGEVLAIKIDKAIVDPNDVEFLEGVVLAGVQQAIERGGRHRGDRRRWTLEDCGDDAGG